MRKSTTTELVTAAEGPPAAATVDLDAIVAEICRLNAVSSLQLSVSIGELILNRFFGGDMAQLRTHGPKNASLRRLAEHPHLPFGASTLSRHVAVYEVIERIGGLQTVKSLTHSHVRHVLGAPAEMQAKLLAEAERQGWTADQLRAEATTARPAAGKGGRKATTVFEKGLTAWRRAVGDNLADALDRIGTLTAPDLAKAKAAVEALQQELAAVAHRIDALGVEAATATKEPLAVEETQLPPRRHGRSGSSPTSSRNTASR